LKYDVMDLDTPVFKLPLVGPIYAKRLENLSIFTCEDLLLHVPSRYQDYRLRSDIAKVQPGESVTVEGEVVEIKNQYTRHRKNLQIASIKDTTGSVQIVWFNQPFLVKSIRTGDLLSVSGKLSQFNRNLAFISPEFEVVRNGKKIHTGRLVPKYPETYGLSSKWLRGKIAYIYERSANRLDEFMPELFLKKESLKNYRWSVENVHFPENLEDAQKGKERLAFNELLFLQLKSVLRKDEWVKHLPSENVLIKEELLNTFSSSLPFSLTASQLRSIKEVYSDLQNNIPMNRLLEGDVGSGKTAVAAAAIFAVFANGFQSVIMAPTQILAQQHFITLKQLLSPFKVRVELVTSAGIEKELGNTDVFVGTHALLHKKVKIEKAALVVIDEQHRFGVEQRSHLIKKSGRKKYAPHVLTMTATPIPRTVALTVYGDLDLSTLDELPKGRQPVTTWVVPQKKREPAYDWIKSQIDKDGIQVFVICPLIEESEKESMQAVKAATVEFERLKSIFSKYKLGLLHGKLKAKEKTQILDDFKEKKFDILVSTPVVEVGIDVANATIMLIEGAERFGLAQLHQLRGRVGRGDKKSYCLLFAQSRSISARQRLTALTKTMSGFELAELDLKLRGPGEIVGLKQHGFPELKIASWQDTELIRLAKQTADSAYKNRKMYEKLFLKLKLDKIVFN
jgi:ATP-dependent DNA helicase RecG